MHFSVLRFSPVPEEIEHANVALLVGERATRLLYLEDFPRLTCVAPNFNQQLLVDHLRVLETDLQNMPHSEVSAALEMRSAQFSVTPPRRLLVPFSRDVRMNLIRAFLRREARRKSVSNIARQHVSGKIGEYLNNQFGIDTRMTLRRASPEQFLTHRTRQAMGENGFRIARVIDGASHLVLMDGLDLEQAPQTIKKRSSEVGYAYYRMRKLEKVVMEEEQRKLHLMAFLFGQPCDQEAEYAVDVATKDAQPIVWTRSVTEPPVVKYLTELLHEASRRPRHQV